MLLRLVIALGLGLVGYQITLAAPEAPAKTASGEAPIEAGIVAKLIEQLGSDDFFVRERAQEQLATIGIEAFDALSEAENDVDVERSQRVRQLLRLVRVQWSRSSDPPEIKRLLDQYGAETDESRERLIAVLGAQPLPHSVTVLCRIVRFEKSHYLSRVAALSIMEKELNEVADRKTRDDLIGASLGSSPRVTAEWLRNFVSTQRDPAGTLNLWDKWIDEEQRTLGQFPTHTRSSVVLRLIQQQVDVLRSLKRDEDAQAAIRRALVNEPEDNDALGQLLDWLVKQKAWPVIDDAAKRFADRLNQEPLLLYTLAEAAEAQGQSMQAEAYVRQARQAAANDPEKHFEVAQHLQIKGKLLWAIEEYRLGIKASPPLELSTINARSQLAELLHDQGQDAEAAQTIEESLTAIEAAVNAGRQELNMEAINRIYRSRMHYFAACDLESKNDRPGQWSRLQKAITDNSLDADVLISLFRFPHTNKADKDKISQQIRTAADSFRRKIQEDADNPTNYNQLAWLIANTEGDFREALRCSQTSLEMQPNTAAYLDTLGRCYFAVGDLDNAIKSQREALKHEPHSGLMQRQLKQFEQEKAK